MTGFADCPVPFTFFKVEFVISSGYRLSYLIGLRIGSPVADTFLRYQSPQYISPKGLKERRCASPSVNLSIIFDILTLLSNYFSFKVKIFFIEL